MSRSRNMSRIDPPSQQPFVALPSPASPRYCFAADKVRHGVEPRVLRSIEDVERSNSVGSSTSTSNGRLLPGLHELFASNVLVAPGSQASQRNNGPFSLPPLRRDSLYSHHSKSPQPAILPPQPPIVPLQPAVQFANPPLPVKADIIQPRVDDGCIRSTDLSRERFLVPPTAQLYADPDFKPSTAGFSVGYLGIKNVQGFGAFHIYDGGYCIPTHVDGVYVNPYWGLTKSKNPRKRLPVACDRCRRKKIRCEPSVAGCLQCQKSRRQCEMPTCRTSNKEKAFREYIAV